MNLNDLEKVLNSIKPYIGFFINYGYIEIFHPEDCYEIKLKELLAVYGIYNFEYEKLASSFKEIRYKLNIKDFNLTILFINEYDFVYEDSYDSEYTTFMYIGEEVTKTIKDVKIISEIE